MPGHASVRSLGFSYLQSAYILSCLFVSMGQSQTLSIEEVAQRMRNQSVTGATIITHGYQISNTGGDSMMPLASVIQNNTGGWLLDYDIAGDGAQAMFDAAQSVLPAANEQGTMGHAVLLFDWAPESNEVQNGWGEAAGESLYSLIVALGLANPREATSVPLHFISHSFGTAVSSEAVERLVAYDIEVDHVTFLDPHEFDQAVVPVDEDQRLFELGQPLGYGASVWNGVQFADAYYQTRGHNGSFVPDALVPNGRPIPGAYNVLMNPHLPALGSYGFFDGSGDHSYVWSCLYQGTVTGVLPASCPAPSTPLNLASTGWAFSQFSGSGVAQPAPVFYGGTQSHTYSETILVDPATGDPNVEGLNSLNLTANEVTQGQWDPTWNRLLPANFDLAAGDTNVSDINVPGWSHHGGGGNGNREERGGAGNHALELNFGDANRIHNRTYVPHDAGRLSFNKWISDASSDDVLEVRLGTTLLGIFSLAQADDFFTITRVSIPGELRDRVNTLRFEIVNFGLAVDSEVRIDNVIFLLGIIGDMDGDGDVDFDDIDEFVFGLNDPAGFEAMFGVPPAEWGDTDMDDDLDFDDIPGFVAILSGGGSQAVPEPSTVVLLCAAGVWIALCACGRRNRSSGSAPSS